MRTKIGCVALLAGMMGIVTETAAAVENNASLAGKRGLSPIITTPADFQLTDSNGNKIIYERIATEDGAHGVIRVISPSNKVLYTEAAFPPPGCPDGEFKTPKFLPIRDKWYFNNQTIVLCGSDVGHQHTLIFIEHGHKISSLYFEDSNPNLEWVNEFKTYHAKVICRLMTPEGSLDSFLVIYEWNPSALLRDGFQPIFNSHSRAAYLSNYKEWKGWMMQKDPTLLRVPALVALISTADSKFICSELTKAPLSNFSKKEIKDAISFSQEYGFPEFDFAICKGV